MPKIEYYTRQPLGPNGCLYIRDIDKKYFSNSKNMPRYAWFICPECGNGFISRIASVKNGHTQSCGCKNIKQVVELGKRNKKDIAGQQFGYLTALYRTDKKYKKRRTYYWKCYCDCGQKCPLLEQDRYVDVIISDLTSGHCVKSNKCHYSSGELKINNILQQHKIAFYPQYTFEDCINPDTNMRLRFDFYLPDYNCCIEYDGEQHFSYKNNYGWNNKQAFEKTQYRDNLKNIYCLSNNIKMVRIPYTEFDNINFTYLLNKILY